jgi:hypothetical protein
MRIIFGAPKGHCNTLYIQHQQLWPQIYLEVNKLENTVKFWQSLDAFRPKSSIVMSSRLFEPEIWNVSSQEES